MEINKQRLSLLPKSQSKRDLWILSIDIIFSSSFRIINLTIFHPNTISNSFYHHHPIKIYIYIYIYIISICQKYETLLPYRFHPASTQLNSPPPTTTNPFKNSRLQTPTCPEFPLTSRDKSKFNFPSVSMRMIKARIVHRISYLA